MGGAWGGGGGRGFVMGRLGAGRGGGGLGVLVRGWGGGRGGGGRGQGGEGAVSGALGEVVDGLEHVLQPGDGLFLGAGGVGGFGLAAAEKGLDAQKQPQHGAEETG